MRYTDGRYDSWYKMERPGVLMENGHITHFTFAVIDVDKGQITGESNHGNKVPSSRLDGVTFDADYGSGGAGGSGDAAASGAARAAEMAVPRAGQVAAGAAGGMQKQPGPAAGQARVEGDVEFGH